MIKKIKKIKLKTKVKRIKWDYERRDKKIFEFIKDT